MEKIDYIVGIILVISMMALCYVIGYNEASIKPVSGLFWIDNNRVHKDSIIDCNPIYNDNIEIIGSWIRVSYEDISIHIECLDGEGYTWQEFRDSWIIAFKDGSKWLIY